MDSLQKLREAMACGANGFRMALGLSGRDHLMDARNIILAKQEILASAGLETKCGLYLDLPATRPRIGRMLARRFHPGEIVQLVDAETTQIEGEIPLPGLPQWASMLEPGHRLMFRDGRNIFSVISHTANTISARCHTASSALQENNGCSFPDSGVHFELLRKDDQKLLACFAAARIKPSGILLSLAVSAAQIAEARRDITAIWPEETPRIIAKIETAYAVENARAIIAEADGVLLGRGDLGIFVPPHRLPRIQEEIVKLAQLAGKPVAVATQFLEHYASTGTPNRAELNDVALAVRQGVDEIILCQETSDSPYALDAISLTKAIIDEETRGTRNKHQ